MNKERIGKRKNYVKYNMLRWKLKFDEFILKKWGSEDICWKKLLNLVYFLCKLHNEKIIKIIKANNNS